MRNYADMHKFTTKSLIKGVPMKNYKKACKIIERRLENRIVAKRPAAERKRRRGFKEEKKNET